MLWNLVISFVLIFFGVFLLRKQHIKKQKKQKIESVPKELRRWQENE